MKLSNTVARIFMVAGLLASAPACSSGIGFRTEPNPWDQICAHEKTYLDSEQSGEPSQIQSAITNLNKDRALFPDDETGTEWLDRVYQGAVAGNPQVARQFWSGNCAHVPYDPPTSSGGPARPSAHPSSK